ncbi:hypothetical protein COI92_06270 [Bacillus anthracis]|nr:hypothetical protein COI92_06270 [Bacillus anthracis]PGW00665.1 hypothetical protein COD87_30805 [Bacillus cereus]
MEVFYLKQIKSDFEGRFKAIEEMKKLRKDFDVNYNFYYDETNNARVFKIKNEELNVHKDKDFVLGGIVLEEDKVNEVESSFYQLREKLKIQQKLKEVKLNNLCPKGSDFLNCIHSKKIRDLLQWLTDKNIYIHFTMLDHLYYSIADIIESLNYDSPFNDNDDFKTMLYYFVYLNTDAFIKILDTYNYPDVGRKQSESFYNEVINFILKTNNDFNVVNEWKVLLYFFIKHNLYMEPTYLENNNKKNDKTLIDEYYLLYFKRTKRFNKGFHFFDEERNVQKKIDEMKKEIDEKGSEIDKALFANTNYQFLDSKDNILIQLSDIVVGILGKLFEFIKNIPIDFIYDPNFIISNYYSFDEYHQKGWELLVNLIRKSVEKNEAFVYMSSNKLLRAKFNKLIGYIYEPFIIQSNQGIY